MKGKNLQPRILDPANSHSDLTEKSKNFTDKEKVRSETKRKRSLIFWGLAANTWKLVFRNQMSKWDSGRKRQLQKMESNYSTSVLERRELCNSGSFFPGRKPFPFHLMGEKSVPGCSQQRWISEIQLD